MKIEITGFTHSKGISKQGRGEPYEMARLIRLSKIRSWKNDFGESRVSGFESNERAALDVDTSNQQMINDLLVVNYPATLDLDLEPHPDDFTRNIVVGFKLAVK